MYPLDEGSPATFADHQSEWLECATNLVRKVDTHAHQLRSLVRDVPCKINLIPFNPFPGSEFRVSPRPRIAAFQRILMDGGLVTTIRKTRGDDIDAACGQLAASQPVELTLLRPIGSA